MSRYTRSAIIESFMELLQKKSLDKIKVKDVIESAQINRNTFYYHFEDIYALLDAVFREAAEHYREGSSEGNSFYQEYLRAADIFLKNREAIIHIYNSKSREVLDRYLKAVTDDFVARFVRKRAEGTEISEEGIQYIINFYSYAIVGNTVHWVESGLPEYRKGLLQTVSDSFEATISIMIEDYIIHHRDT